MRVSSRFAAISLFAAFTMLSACGGDADDGSSTTDAATPGGTPAAGGDSMAADEDAAGVADGAESDHGSAHAAAPGEGEPLLAIMQKLGTDMMTLTHALMIEDAEQVANAAHAIAEHAPIAAEDVERIHRELGNEMPEFERLDEEVHQASVRLHEAAAAGRTDDVLARLNEVQRGCISCHTRFRERLRTNTAR